jgi:hypothetical protein
MLYSFIGPFTFKKYTIRDSRDKKLSLGPTPYPNRISRIFLTQNDSSFYFQFYSLYSEWIKKKFFSKKLEGGDEPIETQGTKKT